MQTPATKYQGSVKVTKQLVKEERARLRQLMLRVKITTQKHHGESKNPHQARASPARNCFMDLKECSAYLSQVFSLLVGDTC